MSRADLWPLLGLVVASAALRLVFHVRYSDGERIVKGLRRDAEAERTPYYRPLDEVFAPMPFLWCWLDIVVLVRAGALLGHWAAWIPIVAIVAGRMRALQEIGHNAVHCAMCRSRGWQWFLSNFFFQFPLMKRDMHSRFVTHVKEHHRNPNDPDRDPNLRRIVEGGVRPGISPAEFHARMFFPLSPRGFWINLRTSVVNSTMGNASGWTVVTRLVSVTLALGVLWVAGGAVGIVVGYVAPLLFVYPLFSWVSLLAEHRWFCPNDQGRDRWEMECINCRPTAFPGLSGWVLRQ
ncbi:MAG: fatty acid desaturase, partial [Polyangiaceae bacterium]